MKKLVNLLALPLGLITCLAWVGCSRETKAGEGPTHDPARNNGDGQTNPTVTGSVTFNGLVTTIDWDHNATTGTTGGNQYDVRIYDGVSLQGKELLPSQLTQLKSYLNNPAKSDLVEDQVSGNLTTLDANYYYLVIETTEYKVISSAGGKDEPKGRHMFVRVYTKGTNGWSNPTSDPVLDVSESVMEVK